ncbi:MAG: YajD family HNH nuclease [Gammaproteobacteria bacterium]
MPRKPIDDERLDAIVAQARRAREARARGYREQALRLLPWVCARCGREFGQATLRELTVHHRDHDHDNNPPDGSNWELLCLYCHDDEHQRRVAERGDAPRDAGEGATHQPFASLRDLLK